jgi:hypothetical protein
MFKRVNAPAARIERDLGVPASGDQLNVPAG